MSRKDRRAAAHTASAPGATLPLAATAAQTRSDQARDLAAAIAKPAPRAAVKPAPTLGCFVRHTYRNDELVSE
jgi:hypothetical protein